MSNRRALASCWILLLLGSASWLHAAADVAHPFMLWNERDAAAIRSKLDIHEWAKAEFEQMKQWRGPGEVHRNLFLISVLGDEKVAASEKKDLLSFIDAKVDSRLWSDQYLAALRYDILYDRLTAEERKKIEDTFRVHIRHELENDEREYTRTSWLPNMQWPRKNGAMLMAVALRDEALIRALFNGNGGWKWYFDEYISDGYFYNEEFGKHYSNIGEMLLWCRGLERLGLNGLGYGYVGQGASGGATMRKYLESIILVGYPRVDLGTDRPHYPKLTMGDAKGKRGFPGYAFQHPIVSGFLADGTGGDRRFMSANMNGRDHKNRKVEKLELPMWFEIAHAKWPAARFDYFLAQLRWPDQNKYYPSLFWGLEPIEPKKVTAPPAPSGAYVQRGIAVLRWNETPAYWESPEPAVTLRFATPYVHEVPDCFSIIGYYAFNRPLYVNRQVSAGYAGTDPGWSSSIRSHAGVQVDGLEPARVGELPARSDFNDLVKFVAVRGKDIYPGVDQTRALFLTKEYLLDVFALSSHKPRLYQWMVHTLGHACPDNPGQWAPTRHLVGTLFDVARERSCVTDRTWTITSTQYTAGAHPELSGFGERWFDAKNRIGVRMTMLGEEGTIAYHGLGPVTGGARERILHGAVEPGGVTIAAARTKPATVFVALHEPFRGAPRIGNAYELFRAEDAIAVEVPHADGKTRDIVMLRWGEKTGEPIAFATEGLKVSFRSNGFVRLTSDRIEATGGIDGLHLLEANRKLTLHGKPVDAVVVDGYIQYGPKPKPAQNVRPFNARPDSLEVISIFPNAQLPDVASLRWSSEIVRIPRGGKTGAKLHVRHLGLGSILRHLRGTGWPEGVGLLRLTPPTGVTATPATINLRELKPGDELSIDVELAAAPDTPPLLDELRIETTDPAPWAVQATPLRVSVGVNAERTQLWPRDFASTVYAPRYIVKFHYLETTAAALIRDPLGLRRSAGDTFRPQVLVMGKDQRGREGWTPMTLGKFQAFSPVARTTEDGEYFLADMGQHPHGYSSAFEWRFHEDWIIVKLRQPPEGQAIFDWSPDQKFAHPGVNPELAKEKMPGIALYAVGDKIMDKAPKDGTPVAAVFERPSGFEYGQATLYPPDSVAAAKGKVAQPADQPMAFTFCMEAEFAGFVKKWQSLSGLVYVKPWSQGDMGR